jgi:hypothetical protein
MGILKMDNIYNIEQNFDKYNVVGVNCISGMVNVNLDIADISGSIGFCTPAVIKTNTICDKDNVVSMPRKNSIFRNIKNAFFAPEIGNRQRID